MFASRLLAACFLNKRVVVGDKFPWLLKNSFALKSQKQNCVRMRYERSSRIPRHFGSPEFRPFPPEWEFFNTQGIYQQLCSVTFTMLPQDGGYGYESRPNRATGNLG